MDDRFDKPSASTTPPPLDREALERILNLGDSDLRVALCEQLISDFKRLRAAIDDEDAGQAARAAHELKGLAATVGASTVTDLARALDAALQGLPSPASAGMIAPLQGQVDLVVDALQSATRGHAGA